MCDQDKVRNINHYILHARVKQFQGGQIKNFLENWQNITSDIEIIQIIKFGLSINIEKDVKKQSFEYKVSKENSLNLDNDNNLIVKGVIEKSKIEQGDYFSTVFTTLKKMVDLE